MNLSDILVSTIQIPFIYNETRYVGGGKVSFAVWVKGTSVIRFNVTRKSSNHNIGRMLLSYLAGGEISCFHGTRRIVIAYKVSQCTISCAIPVHFTVSQQFM
jgi:hypothetical protein